MQRLTTLLATLLLLAGCATSSSGPQAVENGELMNAADGTVIAIKRGGELKVVLDINPTMNFPWEVDANVGPALAPIGQRIYVGKGINSFDIAAGGFNIFRYRAEQPGQVTPHFASRRHEECAAVRMVTMCFTIAAAVFNIFRYRAEQPGKVTLHFASRRHEESAPLRMVHYEV